MGCWKKETLDPTIWFHTRHISPSETSYQLIFCTALLHNITMTTLRPWSQFQQNSCYHVKFLLRKPSRLRQTVYQCYGSAPDWFHIRYSVCPTLNAGIGNLVWFWEASQAQKGRPRAFGPLTLNLNPVLLRKSKQNLMKELKKMEMLF